MQLRVTIELSDHRLYFEETLKDEENAFSPSFSFAGVTVGVTVGEVTAALYSLNFPCSPRLRVHPPLWLRANLAVEGPPHTIGLRILDSNAREAFWPPEGRLVIGLQRGFTALTRWPFGLVRVNTLDGTPVYVGAGVTRN